MKTPKKHSEKIVSNPRFGDVVEFFLNGKLVSGRYYFRIRHREREWGITRAPNYFDKPWDWRQYSGIVSSEHTLLEKAKMWAFLLAALPKFLLRAILSGNLIESFGRQITSWAEYREKTKEKLFNVELGVLEENIRRNHICLDLMCGTAPFTSYLKGVIFGIDIGLGQTSRPASSVKFVHGDIRRLPFSSQSFDVVFCTGFSLEMFSTEELRRSVIPEVKRVLHPGGKFIFSVRRRISFYGEGRAILSQSVKNLLKLRSPWMFYYQSRDGLNGSYAWIRSIRELRNCLAGLRITEIRRGAWFWVLVCQKCANLGSPR